jgi:transposase-like protein
MDCQATSFLSLTQSDLTAVPLPMAEPVAWPAQRLGPDRRQELAVQVLAGTHPVAELARQHQVSRKFLYRQAHTAQQALSSAFEPQPTEDGVLFSLPVTKAWLRQLILALVLIGHSPYRAVVELLRDLFDWEVSLGTVHNIVHSAVEPARAISRA